MSLHHPTKLILDVLRSYGWTEKFNQIYEHPDYKTNIYAPWTSAQLTLIVTTFRNDPIHSNKSPMNTNNLFEILKFIGKPSHIQRKIKI